MLVQSILKTPSIPKRVIEMERQRGRPRALNREVIISEALKLRPHDFSLPRVAEELGVSLPALYHYFPNKEALASAMVEQINELVKLADHQVVWHQYLRTVLIEYRAFLKQSDYAFGRGSREKEVSFFRVAGKKSEKLLERFNGFIQSLAREGLSPSECVEVWIVFQDFVRNSVLTGASQADLTESWEELHADLKSIELDDLTHLQALPDMPSPDAEATFEAAVEVLIGGLAKRYGLKL